MKLHLALTLAGTFVLDDESNIINTKPFKLDPKEVATKIILLDSEKLPSEITDILKEHKISNSEAEEMVDLQISYHFT